MPQPESQLAINRPVVDLAGLEENYLEERTNPSCLQSVQQCCSRRPRCTTERFLRVIFSILPFIRIMKSYKIKKYLLGDIVSGLSVALLNIPECLGYAVLAGLPPFYGLYASFYPLLVYFVFGTSRHNSMGTMAMVSYLVGIVINRQAHLYDPGVSTVDNSSTNATIIAHVPQTLVEYKVEIALSLAIMVGAIQIGMFLLQLGILADFMSPQFLGAFLSGGAYLILANQIPYMFGFAKLMPKDLLSADYIFLRTWYWIFKNLPKTNPADFIISVICCTILFVIKDVINIKFKKKLPVPVPAEILVVVGVILASYYGHFSTKYHVYIVKTIPTGLPAPRVPSFPNSTDYLLDAFIIAFLSFVVNMSQAQAMSLKHEYSIDPNQELLASGACQIVTAFFGGFGGAASPPRTYVADSAGGKTQVSGLVDSVVVLIVCLVLAGLFEPLPMAALASVVIVPIIPLFLIPLTVPALWRKDKYDFCVFLVTFLVMVLIDINIGVAVGIGVSLVTLILRSRIVKVVKLSPISSDDNDCPDLFVNEKRCKTKNSTSERITIIKFDCLLYFANVNSFVRQIYKLTVNPVKLKYKLKRSTGASLVAEAIIVPASANGVGESTEALWTNSGENVTGSNGAVWTTTSSAETHNPERKSTDDLERPRTGSGSTHRRLTRTQVDDFDEDNVEPNSTMKSDHSSNSVVKSDQNAISKSDQSDTKCVAESVDGNTTIIILDCSSISRLDTNGANAIRQIRGEYDSVNIRLWLAACSLEMIDILRRNEVDLSWGVYPSLQDALRDAKSVLRNVGWESSTSL